MKTIIGAALLLALCGIIRVASAGLFPEPPSVVTAEVLLSGPPRERIVFNSLTDEAPNAGPREEIQPARRQAKGSDASSYLWAGGLVLVLLAVIVIVMFS